MKKAVCLTITIVLMLVLSSCIKAVPMAFFGDDDNELADARMEQLINLIKEQNKEALKAMFSQKALTEAENIDTGVDYLLSFVEGETVSWNRDNSPMAFDRAEDGGKTNQLVTWYTLDTDKQSYSVFLIDYPIDTIEPENAGLYTLMIIRAEDESKLVGTWEEWAIPGIFIPDK